MARTDVMELGEATRRLHLLVGGARAAHAHVLPYGRVEQHVVLEDDTHLRGQGVQAGLAQVEAVVADAALVGIEEAQDEVEAGALAASARAHERDPRALGDFERDVVQVAVLAGVAERNVLQADGGAQRLHRDGVGALGDAGRRIEQLVDALQPARRLQQRRGETGKRQHGVADVEEERVERNQRPDGKVAAGRPGSRLRKAPAR